LQDNHRGVFLFGIADTACDEFLNDRADRTLDLDQVCLAALVGTGRRRYQQCGQDCNQAG
jgi:hypothetical protein